MSLVPIHPVPVTFGSALYEMEEVLIFLLQIFGHPVMLISDLAAMDGCPVACGVRKICLIVSQ